MASTPLVYLEALRPSPHYNEVLIHLVAKQPL